MSEKFTVIGLAKVLAVVAGIIGGFIFLVPGLLRLGEMSMNWWWGK